MDDALPLEVDVLMLNVKTVLSAFPSQVTLVIAVIVIAHMLTYFASYLGSHYLPNKRNTGRLPITHVGRKSANYDL